MINNIKGYCCTKILPAVYDDAMSYYESICKLTHKVNEVIDFINDVLEKKLNEYILSVFNKIMVDVMYDEPSETITLYLNKEGAEENV